MDRRRFIAGSLGVATVALLPGCTSDGDDGGAGTGGEPAGTTPSPAKALAAPGTAGLIDEAVWQARIDEYLPNATATLNPAAIVSITAHLVAAHRDDAFTWDPSQVTEEALASAWETIDGWLDVRDFRLNELTWVVMLADGKTPMRTIDPALIESIERRMLDNRYQWNDPLPDDRVDNQWFWSENHLIIGLTNEYLAGQRMPDRTFTITGLTGAEHMDRAKTAILEWVDERARFGFFEFHSNVYMNLNVAPLLTLAEFADDPEIVRAAAMALDLCTLDMAGACHAGAYSAARGRTYAKDKVTPTEPTWPTFKLLFDDTDEPWNEGAPSGPTYLSGSSRYRPAQALIDLATASSPGVVRERHGIFVDSTAPIEANPQAPFGFDFDDAANLSFWWPQGMIGTWQMVDASLAAAEEFRLFEETELGQIKALVDLNGGDPDRLREYVRKNHAIVNFGHLLEANTYSWRGDAVALASVQDYRVGEMQSQIHPWEATLAPGAVVFTTHPRSAAPTDGTWQNDGKPGYFTGAASIPRSAQHERTAVHIYQPAWDESTDDLLWSVFGYQPETHAFVPQDRFDEVTRDGNWTFVRKGDGYVALWSWRSPTWREHPPLEGTTDLAAPFDLVAEGGPDNVWIVEVGEQADAGSFADFVAAVGAEAPEVERTEEGFTVRWVSPSAGDIGFGSTGPFTVAGKEISLADFPRHESLVGTVDRLEKRYRLASDGAALDLDFDAMTRTPSA